jgi:hypothetical protein
MKHFNYVISGVLLATMLSGCETVAPFSALGVGYRESGNGPEVKVTVRDIVENLKCQIYDAALADPTLSKYTIPGSDQQYHYFAGALLNLTVNDNGGLAPSFSFISPLFKTTTESYTTALAAQLSATRQRVYSQAFLYDVTNMVDPANKGEMKKSCHDFKDGFHINGINLIGDLGIDEVVALGTNAITSDDQLTDAPFVVPTSLSTGYVPVTQQNQSGIVQVVPAYQEWDCHGVPQCPQPPSFGTTVQFTLTRAVGGGPNWVFNTFKGPTASGGGSSSSGGGGGNSGGSSSGGSSGSGSGGGGPSGLLTAGRTDTHQLYICFVPINVSPSTPEVRSASNHLDDLTGQMQSLVFKENKLSLAKQIRNMSKSEKSTSQAQKDEIETKKADLQADINKTKSDLFAALAAAPAQEHARQRAIASVNAASVIGAMISVP